MHSNTSERTEQEQRSYERFLQTVIDLFRRPSPSGFEFYVRDYVIDQLRSLGFATITDKAGNVLATRGTPTDGGGYPLLSFHMDIFSYGLSESMSSLIHQSEIDSRRDA